MLKFGSAILALMAVVVLAGCGSSGSYHVGDLVTITTHSLGSSELHKASSDTQGSLESPVYRVVSVLDGSNGNCPGSNATFSDQPAGKTYCLNYLSTDLRPQATDPAPSGTTTTSDPAATTSSTTDQWPQIWPEVWQAFQAAYSPTGDPMSQYVGRQVSLSGVITDHTLIEGDDVITVRVGSDEYAKISPEVSAQMSENVQIGDAVQVQGLVSDEGLKSRAANSGGPDHAPRVNAVSVIR